MADVAGRGSPRPIDDSGLTAEELEKEHFYEEVEQGPEFKELERTKFRFIVPATIFFIVYYFALPVLVGYFPDAMDTRVWGNISIGYLFALSQFFMAWIIAFWYLNKAGKVFDVLIAKIVEQAARLRARKGV
jgi:uncharacterized membrane protein (DUF485 family)